jgi:hypothetical protein
MNGPASLLLLFVAAGLLGTSFVVAGVRQGEAGR